MNENRTDLICELIDAQPELYSGEGVMSSEDESFGIKRRRVTLDASAAARLGREAGRYVTLECAGLENADGRTLLNMVDALAAELAFLAGEDNRLFVAGLGNLSVTPDALGPRTVGHLIVSRHLKTQQAQLYDSMELGELSALAPGVLGQTGVESAEIIRAVAQLVSPTALVIIDSLTAMARERLCATVQLSDTGIAPGSGVGNHRFGLTRELLGVPVIAVGIPMVIPVAAFGAQGEENLMVTPKNIDQLIGRAARLIGYAINRYAHKKMSVEDMDSLLS